MKNKKLPNDTVIQVTYENLIGAISATCLHALMNPLSVPITQEELEQRCENYAVELIHAAFLEQVDCKSD